MATRQKHPRTLKPAAKDKRADQKIVPGVTRAESERIGRVIAAWSGLETVLQTAIWAFLKLDENDGRLVTGRTDARPKIDWLRVLGERYLPDGNYANSFFEALSRLGDLREDRNFIAHGVWGKLKPENEPIAMSLRKDTPLGKVGAETFPAARMQSILHDISVALKVIEDAPERLSAWRDKPPPPHPASMPNPPPAQEAATRLSRRRRLRASRK